MTSRALRTSQGLFPEPGQSNRRPNPNTLNKMFSNKAQILNNHGETNFAVATSAATYGNKPCIIRSRAVWALDAITRDRPLVQRGPGRCIRGLGFRV